MKKYLLFLFGVGCLWDVLTTVYGTWVLFDHKALFPLLASITFGLVILALLGSVIWIWKTEGVFGSGFKAAWIVGIAYDLFTSWNGNLNLLFGRSVAGSQFVMLVGLTVFMTLSPIAWVYVFNEDESKFD